MTNNNQGVVLIFVALTISATALIATVAFARMSLAHINISMIERKTVEVESVARGCVDEVIIWTRKHHDYAPGPVITNEGTCDAIVTYPSDNNISILITYSEGAITRSYRIEAEQQPFLLTSVTLTSE